MSHQFFQLLKSISASLSDNEENKTETVLTMIIIIIFTVITSVFINEYNKIE